jgi:hypothetical protein
MINSRQTLSNCFINFNEGKGPIDGSVLMNQEQLLLKLAQHAIKREQFEDLTKIKFKEKGFDLCTISGGRDSNGHFYNVSYLDANEIKSMKVKTKNQNNVVAEENLDELLNQLEKCKCKIIKPNETTWILDGSKCYFCHEKYYEQYSSLA